MIPAFGLAARIAVDSTGSRRYSVAIHGKYLVHTAKPGKHLIYVLFSPLQPSSGACFDISLLSIPAPRRGFHATSIQYNLMGGFFST